MSQFIVPKQQRSLFGGRPARQPKATNAGALQAGRRTMEHLRARGWQVSLAEHWVASVEGKGQQQKYRGGYRKDLGGFIDVLAWRAEPVTIGGKAVCVLAVQTTSRQQIAPHLRAYRDVDVFAARGSAEQAEKKRKEHAALVERMLAWIAAPGCAFVVHGWEPLSVPKKEGGGHKVVWKVEERIVTAADLQLADEERF